MCRTELEHPHNSHPLLLLRFRQLLAHPQQDTPPWRAEPWLYTFGLAMFPAEKLNRAFALLA